MIKSVNLPVFFEDGADRKTGDFIISLRKKTLFPESGFFSVVVFMASTFNATW